MSKVLLVEDDPDIRKNIKQLIENEGVEVVEAPDALEVANMIMREGSSIELVLLDINIGEIDGRDIFEIIKEYAPNLPVIVSSVLPLEEQKLRIPEARGYYCKSQNYSVLIDKIRNIMGVEKA